MTRKERIFQIKDKVFILIKTWVFQICQAHFFFHPRTKMWFKSIGDVRYNSEKPLFPFGFGLSYKTAQ